MGKDKRMVCGFCSQEIENFKALVKIRPGNKTIIICPFCNAILGICMYS